MRILLMLFALGALNASAAEWQPLFDGKTTNGWTPRGEVVKFEAVDNELQLFSKKNVWVVSDIQMSDFIVELEVMLPPKDERDGMNSGLGFRLKGPAGKKPKGYQLEIDLSKPGGVYGIGLGGWLYPKKGQEKEYAEKKKLFKADDWNLVRVHCEGNRIRTYVNGGLVADIEDGKQLQGGFGIQHHGKGGTMRFRNLRVQDLSQ